MVLNLMDVVIGREGVGELAEGLAAWRPEDETVGGIGWVSEAGNVTMYRLLAQCHKYALRCVNQ